MKQEEFITICKRRHIIQYDYSATILKYLYGKITVICPKHGSFITNAYEHFHGKDCFKCERENNISSWDSFLKKSRRIYDEKYSYERVQTIGVTYSKSSFVEISCPIHGTFLQSPILHLNGEGCPNCDEEYVNIIESGFEPEKIVKNTYNFIHKAQKIHKETYDYSKSHYINNHTKVQIRCKIHGLFWQKPNDHLGGHGCSQCGIDESRTKQKDFVRKATKIHHRKYDYSKVLYINSYTKIIINCPVHGYFAQQPQIHLLGGGCPKCAINTQRGNLKKFIKKSCKRHGPLYDYSKAVYITWKVKLEIICKSHGSFWQRPCDHARGSGCPKCKASTGETAIAKALDDFGIEYKRQVSFHDCKNIKQLKFDFGVYKSQKLLFLIEFQGIQHYTPISHFGGEKTLKECQKRDNIKRLYCSQHNIPLLEISYKDASDLKTSIINKYDYTFQRNRHTSQASSR